MPTRPKLPKAVELDVLVSSRRRCALCGGLNGDFGRKKGQIAHADRKKLNSELGSLVWLCQDHHDEYDSRTSQTKRITQGELKHYRSELYQLLAGWPAAASEERAAPKKQPPPVSVEVYDRRIAVYRSVRKFLTQAVPEGPEVTALREFGETTEEALFRFDQEVALFISSLYQTGAKLRAPHKKINAPSFATLASDKAEDLLNRYVDFLTWFDEQLPEARTLFKRYLQL